MYIAEDRDKWWDFVEHGNGQFKKCGNFISSQTVGCSRSMLFHDI
jgi:hypothetical protein